MKNNKHPHVDLGLLAMPLFCSLLGAILILTFSSASARLPLPREKVQELSARLMQARLAINQSLATQTIISNRIDLDQYRTVNARLEAQLVEKSGEITNLMGRVSKAQIVQGRLEEIRRRAEAGAADVVETRARLVDLEARTKAAKTNPALGLIGSYRGSLVLLECDRQGVTVHPGGRKLADDAPEREFDSVFTEIDRAGFVVLVTRPGGFTKSYPRTERLVSEHIQAANKSRNSPIGICAFPLDDAAPLTAFLPKGASK